MALIIDDPMPKDCSYCDYRCGCNLLSRTAGCRAEGCPIIGEVNLDKYVMVVLETGDGTIIGYKDVPIRELLGFKENV